jgi:hypothetical protein
MSFKIKIVPNAAPNADGRWITIEGEAPMRSLSCRDTFDKISHHAPEGYHVVAFERIENGTGN